METYAGIDYGMGLSNVDKDTGIRYGIISQHDLSSYFVNEEMEADYGEPSCPKCGNDVIEFDEEKHNPDENEETEYNYGFGCADFVCEACQYVFDSSEAYPDEPQEYTYEEDGYSVFLDSSGDVWITKSLYYTHAQFCSPCAPGCGHLNHPLPKGVGVQTYCFDKSFFENEECLYSYWSVETGELVYTPEKENDYDC